MSKLADIIAQERRLQRLRREVDELRLENQELHTRVERMSTAMRRCVTCEYHPRNRVSDDEG
jgi:predicted RNase H-like nuclease (RuvC/YqgF family)